MTAASTGQTGGLFAATSVPTSQGLDATFNTYQYGGNGADGITFVLAAVNPADPLSPATIGPSGGALGYSAYGGINGLANAYMGIGFDTYGNFSNSAYEGSGCINPAYIKTNGQVPGQVLIRGPGNGTVGYCAVNSTATTTPAPPLALRAITRAASQVPVEVAINPTSGSFTTASGITVAAGTYKVVFTPVGGSATTLSGTLPTVPTGLYPSSWLSSGGIPLQLSFGWVASTGGSTDFHEIDAANVVSFTATPQLAVTQTAYSAASPALGAPVTYTVNPSVSASGASEGSPVSVSETMPAGVTPVGAYGPGWTCGAPSGQVITCTNSATPFAAGTSLPALTVEGIVTASGVTSTTIQSGSKATASSADGNPGLATTATAGTVPTAPSGVAVSPVAGTIAGGNDVTVSGTNVSAATAIYIGTTSQQQAGTPAVLLPCASGVTVGCFTVNANGSLNIASMPAVAASATVNVTVVTLGIAGAASYAYTDKPGTPAAPTATPGITSATVTWVAPASNNSPITGYIVTPYLNGVPLVPLVYGASTTTQTLTGLIAGASYTFTVTAVNAIGTGSASPQSAAVIPYVLPGAPGIGSVSAGDSAATVSWTAPASNGFSAITGYVVTPYIAGVAQTSQTFSSAATTESVTGLTPGTSYTFKVAAVNAAGTGPASAASAAVTINAGPSLTFPTPPAGEVTIGYSDQLTASGGTGALTWSVSSGSLPPGLSLSSSTGLLSGTPTTAGSYPFTVKITDSSGGSATQPATLVIAAVPSLANAAPPAGQAAVAYSDALSVTGGTGPFTWAVSGGALPPGLTLNASTGVLSGTPSTAGLYTFTVKVTDSFGLTATQSLNVTVGVGPLVISASANASTVAQGGTLGYTITITNTAASAYSGVTFSAPLSNVLAGAVYNNNAAATSGTATVTGQTLTWTGTLAAGAVATITFSVTVGNPYTGTGTLSFTVTSPTTGTNCPANGTDPRCTLSVPVSALTITQTASAATAAPGAVVGYTITVTNSGLVAYSGATFTDPLAGVLANAAYNGNAAATAGSVSFASPNLTWTGNLAAGATATITFSVTVSNPDAGSKILASTITSATSGANCFAGSADARCTATVTVQGLTITSTASTASTTPGATVQYTITVTNSGQAAYTGASITDSLAGVLDDAVYNGDAAATVGGVSYASPNLTWTGNLAPGATATITFSATVRNPDTGDKVLATAITSTAPASNCPAGGTNPACSTSVTVLVPALTIAMSSGVSSTTPGSTVAYTVTVTNSGQTPYTGTSAVVSLTGVLDDAAYNNNAAATAGSVSYASPNLTWTGNLAVGATATITYSVTVANPDTGNHSLASSVTSAAAGGNCPSGGSDPRCSTTVPVLTPGLNVAVTANTASTTAGSVVQYTIAADNTGQTTDTGVLFTDALAGVLDDAAYNGDAAASTGTVSFASPNLTWTGTLAPGATATITFSVTVNNPDTGNKILTSTLATAGAGSNCQPGSTDTDCSSTVTVASLVIVNTASVATTTPGSVVRYTSTFTNTGQAAYTGITVSSNITDVLDDATPNGDQTATSGTLTLTGTGITWTGNIPVGGTVTVTGTVTVNNPDTGNKVMTSTLTTAAPGSNCPSGGTDPRCTATVNVLIPGLTIVKTANVSTTTPGSVVGYTVTVTDSGQTPYTGATFSDSLSGLLPDAAYNGNAAATSGSVSYAAPVLTWTGNLAVGATATITYSVTVNNPDTGDKSLSNTVTSTTTGSNCPVGGSDPRCTATVQDLVPGLTLTVSANNASTTAGSVVQYTVTAVNTGQTTDTGVSFTDALAGVLDDATYNGNAAATVGSVSFASPNLTWTGTLAPGATATVTFSVTVNNPDTGNGILSSAVTSAAVGSNCPSGGTAPACSSTVTVASLLIVSTASVATTTPGSVVRYTATFTNTGQTAYTGITVSINTSGVEDDATPNGDQTATSGTLAVTGTAISWTGSIPVGGAVTVTGTVTVNNPDTGDKVMASTLSTAAAGSNCPAGSADPRCTSTVNVLIPGLTIVKTANTSVAVPGQVVGYTITVTDSGQTPYTGAVVTDSLASTANDAVYNNDAVATAGSVSYAAPVLTWTGSLAPGATATITYSVTVNNPDTGGKLLINTVASSAVGSSCPPGTTSSPCQVTVPVLTPALTIVKTASAATAVPGQTITYTVAVTDSGQTPYTGAALTDSLAGVLGDAAYDNDAAATAGSVSYAAPNLAWTGSLSPGESATITYSVTVDNPDTGGHVLTNTVSSPTPGSNCPAGATDPRCASTVTVSQLTIVSTPSAGTVTPGTTVTETTTITNTGQTPYNGISVSFTTPNTAAQISDVGNETASSGTLSIGTTGAVWTGDVPVGATVTLTGGIIVANPWPAGGQVITLTGATTAPGSNCPSGSADPRCTMTVNVVIPGLTIVKTANVATTTPGSVVGYTITVTDSGQTPYTGAVVTDDLTGVLNDAVYNGNAAATAGSVSYTAPALTWTGSLAPGDSATITYSATVNNPDTGGKVLINTVASSAVGSTCPPGTTSSPCQITIPVLTPALTIVKTASTATAAPGQTVTYTITVTDSGQTPYTGATLTDPLAGVLDDAAYNNDAAATAGSVSYAAPNLTWTGNLAPGDAATITYSVTVHNPDTGNGILAGTITSPTTDSNCPSGGTDPNCTATVDVSGLTIVNTASTPVTTPGGVVGYTITATNSGQATLTGATLTADFVPALDDGSYNGDATATTGTVTLASAGSSLTWTGNLAVGATVTISFSVTVDNPDTGDKTLTNTVASATPGSTCPSGSANPACTAVTTVLIPGLAIANTASTSTPVPGSVVGYTLTITNTGQTAYTGATVTDTITPMLDDAAYNGDAAATAGGVSYASGVLTWTGTLAPGAAAVVTFSVTVDNPDTGDKLLVATASSAAAGSTCPPGTTSPPCRSTVGVLTPGLTIVSTAAASTTVPGATVGYTITITDTGQTPYTGATVADALAGLLDDAAYNNDATASTGSVSYASPVLTWTGSLAPGDAATITFSATVSNPDTGDKILSTTATSTATGSNCSSGSTDPDCATSIPVSVLTITNTASVSTTTPGSTVSYTITVTNAGRVDLSDLNLAVPLGDVLDDAAYNGDAAATEGLVSLAGSQLTWDGDLDQGQTAVIRFTVTVDNPDTGNKTLADTITSTTPGSTCPASGTAPAACTAVVTVLIPGLTITTTAGSATTTPGSVVVYTIAVTDTGQTPYAPATVTDDLANALNDSAYNGDAAATSGTVAYAGHVLTWTGNLAPGDTATITYSITMNNPDNGDKHLVTTAVSTDPGSTCPPASANPACTAIVTDLIPALTITKTANVASAAPGTPVDYTITVADTGQTPYTGATVTDDLTGVLGAAAYNGDATATTGTVAYASPALTWTGSLAPGDTAAITYSVTVDNPETGGTSLVNTATSAAPGSTCPPGTASPPCAVTTAVITGPLSMTAPASAALGAGAPGTTISSSLGTVGVTDGRGFGADWAASVSSSDFTTGAGGPAETIPAGDALYDITALTTATGPATFGFTPQIDLSANPQDIVSATNVDGNTAVTWNPVIGVAVPGGAIGGTYSGTIVHSVS